MKLETEKYSFDELKIFYGLLDEAWRETKSRNRSLSVHDMLKRLFACVASGERKPELLKAAMLVREDAILPTGLLGRRPKPFSYLPMPDAYLIRMVGRPVMRPAPHIPPSEIPIAL
jgi:hypothetical protein